jgi:TFIIF-interacting CTD phosphatase-like protein
MQANDLITQVNSDEDENGHADHLDASDSSSGRQSFVTRFLSCFLCKAKQPPSMAGRGGGGGKQQSSLYSKHPTIPLQSQSASQHQHGNSSNNNSAAISLTTTNLAASSASNSNKTAQLPLPQSAIPLTSPSPPAVQMNGAPPSKYLLPPMSREEVASNRKTLVLDLDETLVHSSFKPIPNADFVLSIDLEGVIHRVYVRKRPGVDHFLRCCAERFEVVVFTASLAKVTAATRQPAACSTACAAR